MTIPETGMQAPLKGIFDIFIRIYLSLSPERIPAIGATTSGKQVSRERARDDV
jgi:hypothetical protein